jgi:hypothetical protein
MTSPSYPQIHVQRRLNFKFFTDYKGIMKSWNLVVNVPERMEVPKKTIQASSIMKRGRTTITKKDNASNKHSRIERMRSLQKIVNVSQPMIDRHIVNINMPQSRTQARNVNDNASTSENPNTPVLGNHVESNGIEEISINDTSSKEVYDLSTTIAN